jgi:hypothetical protein
MSVSPTDRTYGDQSTFPAKLRSQIPVSDVIYWSYSIPHQPICLSIYCDALSQFPYYIPCFWPHMLILSGPLCFIAAYSKTVVLGTYAVLTNTSLALISDSSTEIILLSSLVSVEATTNHRKLPCGSMCCIPDINRIELDTGRRTRQGRTFATTLWAHDNQEEFVRLLLDAKQKQTPAVGSQMQLMMGMMQQFIQMPMGSLPVHPMQPFPSQMQVSTNPFQQVPVYPMSSFPQTTSPPYCNEELPHHLETSTPKASYDPNGYR